MSFVVSLLAALALGQAAPAEASPQPQAAAPATNAATGGGSTGGAPAKPSKATHSPTTPKGAIAPNSTDQMFSSGPLDKAGATAMRGDSMATMSMNRLADQRALAKKAAVLINGGHCPEALQLVVDKGDGLLAENVAKACGLPAPTFR